MTGEAPLRGAAKSVLILSAALTIALFYAFVVGSILLLLLILAGELVAFAAALRFGLARFITPFLQRHTALLSLFIRSFWTRRRIEFQVPLEEPDAPALFSFLRELSRRLQVPAPRRVRLEMNASAWVLLKGIRRGADATTLGLGYDLVAALTEREIEAVLAHEMAHAKLVRRGLRSWLNGGLARAAKLTNELSSQVVGYRRVRQSFELGEWFLNPADRCTRLAARLVATYSRQDEFEADRGAAELGGAAPLRSALVKLDHLAAKTARIGWNERVAQLQRGEGFSSWLAEELTVADAGPGGEGDTQPLDSYSTHPSTRDRLAALPLDPIPAPPSRRAIELFAHPDALAAKLMAEIHRIARLEEERDNREQRRWLKRTRRGTSTQFQPLQGVALIIGLVAIFVAIFAWADGFRPSILFVALLVMAGAVGLFRLGRRRDRLSLPVPDFEIQKIQWENPDDPKAREIRETELVAAFQSATAALKKKPKRDYLVTESYAALAHCDYLRAHVAARQCVQANGKQVEALLALAVASAAFGQTSQVRALLGTVHKYGGLRSPSTTWGAGWALLLSGDWAAAEAFLTAAQIQRPDVSTFPALIAVCQGHRNKLHSAIAQARRAFAAAPGSAARIKLLVELLLDGGYLREAEQLLTAAGNAVRSDPELTLAMIRLHLLLRDFAAADQWIATLRQHSISGQTSVRLGNACETARRDELAASFFAAALTAGFYPEAHLGLARLAVHRRDFPAARQSILTSLNTSQTLGEKASGPLDLFPLALTQILHLEDPIPNARAWIATFNNNAAAGPLARLSFQIYATDEGQAETFLKTIAGALQPDQPPVQTAALGWRLAPRDQQPIGAVRPGIQNFWQ